MGDILDFVQSNWYEIGSLAFQFAILAVVVWFGRKAVRVLSAPLVASSVASQAQVELLRDLEKLSETRVPRPAPRAPVAQPETYVSRPAVRPETTAPAYGGVGRMFGSAPAAVAESHAEAAEALVENHTAAAAAPRREGFSPWKMLVSWLNTPWGSPAGLSRRQAS